jgi:hypothetical protein
MLICTAVSLKDKKYYILDTHDKDFFEKCEDGEEYSLFYTEEQLKDTLQTTEIIGLNKDAEYFVDEEMMYGADRDWFVLDIHTNTVSPWVYVSNLTTIFAYDLEEERFSGKTDMIENLDVEDIELIGDMLYVTYNFAGNLMYLRVCYNLNMYEDIIEDWGGKLYDEATGKEIDVELPISIEKAKKKIQDLGINAKLNEDDSYIVYNRCKIGVVFENKEEGFRYAVFDDKVVRVLANNKGATTIYKEEGN